MKFNSTPLSIKNAEMGAILQACAVSHSVIKPKDPSDIIFIAEISSTCVTREKENGPLRTGATEPRIC